MIKIPDQVARRVLALHSDLLISSSDLASLIESYILVLLDINQPLFHDDENENQLELPGLGTLLIHPNGDYDFTIDDKLDTMIRNKNINLALDDKIDDLMNDKIKVVAKELTNLGSDDPENRGDDDNEFF